MKLKKAQFFWLRTTTMAHPGYPPGAPWNCNPNLFATFEDGGLVESHYDRDTSTGQEFRYAVATSKGHAIIRHRGSLHARA